MKQQATSGSLLPSDLTSEILLRLPAKSIGRFRCVSKLWLSIITDPCFIKSFGITRPSLLLCSRTSHNLFATLTPQHTHQIRSYSASQPIHNYHIKLPGEHCYFSHMISVHGLICIKDAHSRVPMVWNPSTGQLLLLPKPNMSSKHVKMFLGYDSVEGKHKVVCLPYKKTCYVCLVFTLGSGQESWRTVRTNLEHECGYSSGLCIKGVIYYLALFCQGHGEVIMCFDVRSEKFRMIKLPSYIHWDVLISYKGRLACIDQKNDRRLWILEDAWSSQDFLLPLHQWTLSGLSEDYQYNPFKLKGSTHAGEFIYVPFRFQKSTSYIVFYDPVRNSCRRLKFEGNVGKDFGINMHVFPNHIETLTSL